MLKEVLTCKKRAVCGGEKEIDKKFEIFRVHDVDDEDVTFWYLQCCG